MTTRVETVALTETERVAQNQRLFEAKGVRWAQWALIFLILAVLLIVLGAYFNIKYFPSHKWLMAIWITGIVLFLFFAFFVYRQSKVVSCMRDMTADGCLESIGKACG